MANLWRHNGESQVDDVFVGVVGAELPWLLNSPPRDWSVPSVLLIGLKQECDPRALLQTALAQRTPAVAALCLAKLGEQRNKLEFRVFTWRPLHPRRKLLPLGGWNASRFASWDQLFVDRFSSFGGVTLHVASNTNEPPALFKTNSSQLDGLGYRILSTLAEKYNFNFTLTTTSSDGMWAENHKGVWKGMLGDVHRGEKNLTINTIYITYHQAAAFDFSIPFKYEGPDIFLNTTSSVTLNVTSKM
ncbi:uncharacterized protein [Penaeus vannamei]|uniref:uncharacterized protein n=1 Tax=Penaeus vannamei TaxID=6689 RepID=UPI00387F9F4A